MSAAPTAALAAVLAAVVIGSVRVHGTFPGFSMTGDALLYAELGRNVAAGAGFVSSFVYPISLAYPPLQALPQPHMLYHPGYPSVLAVAFRLAGPRDEVVLWTNTVLAWALLALVFLLARRLFGPWAACVATAALALDTTVASNVRNGGSEILAMVCVTAAAAFLVTPAARGRAVLAGVLLGLAYLVRPNLAVLVPLAAGALWRAGARASIGPLLAGAVLVIGPWIVRGWLVMGQPLFSLYGVANIAWDTPSFPGMGATYGTLTPRGLGVMLTEYPWELADKVRGNLLYYARQAPFLASPVAVAAFAVGLLVKRRSGDGGAVRVDRALGEWAAAAVVVTVALVSLIAREPRYLAPVAPVIVALGVGWTFAAVASRARSAMLPVLAAIVLLALPAAGTARDLLKLRGPDATSRWRDPNLPAVAALTRDSDVIVTDIGRGVTWYARRSTIQAPVDRATLERIDATILPVSTIYLSGSAPARWRAMYGAPLDAAAYVPAGFEAVASFPDGGRLWRKRPPPP